MSEVNDENDGNFPPHVEMVERILDAVEHMQNQQNYWNEEVHRFFVTEAIQKEESDRLTRQVQSSEANALNDESFGNWISRRCETELGENTIKKWYHIHDLVEKTPFVALVPCPRLLSEEGRMELVRAVDALNLERFLIQTITLHAPLSKIAPTFIPLCFHLPQGQSVSKSNLGDLPYVGIPCVYGGDTLKLISEHTALANALDCTPCLFLNDYVPRAVLCIHSVTVGGVCVAGEVACDARFAAKLGLDLPLSQRVTKKDTVTVFSSSLKEFVEGQIASCLEKRSFRALLLAEATPGRGRDIFSEKQPLMQSDLRFTLLNMDTLDGCEFECFTQQDILDIVQRMTECKAEDEVFLPALRFLQPSLKNHVPDNRNCHHDPKSMAM